MTTKKLGTSYLIGSDPKNPDSVLTDSKAAKVEHEAGKWVVQVDTVQMDHYRTGNDIWGRNH